MVVLVDEEDRENEGDLVLAAEFVTPEAINFMAKYARGLICLTLTPERCEQLNLPLMTSSNRSGSAPISRCRSRQPKVCPVAYRPRTALAPYRRQWRSTPPTDIVQPGHIFPVMAQPGGVLMRAGHTEAGAISRAWPG